MEDGQKKLTGSILNKQIGFIFMKLHKSTKVYRVIIVGLILIIAIILRGYNLSVVPPSPSLDEVSIGWNAYSILNTSKDEFGTRYPLVLRAYDDYRPALYVYFVIPFLRLLGLTAQAVRFPSFVLSILTLISTWILIRRLFPAKVIRIGTISIPVADITLLFLAISPWHVYLSRLGHEANAGLTFGILGITLFFEFLGRQNRLFLALSAFSFIAALYSYQSQKIIIPIILVGLGMIYFLELKRWKWTVLCISIISFVILIPLFQSSISSEGMMRLRGTQAFTEDNPYYEARRRDFVEAQSQRNPIAFVVNHPRLITPRLFIEQYLLHFSPEWLFLGTQYASHKVPYMGLLYVWELPLMIVGFISLVRGDKRFLLFFLVWFLSSPIPAAITVGVPHAMRSYTFLPTWQILSSLGLVVLISRTRYKLLVMSSISLVLLVSFYFLLHNYFVQFPLLQSQSFAYALTDAIKFTNEHKNKYNKIVFNTMIGPSSQTFSSYMFVLFHTAHNPQAYAYEGGSKTGSFHAERAFGMYQFVSIFPNRDGKTLYVDTYPRQGKSVEGNILYVASYKDGTPGVVVYD